MNQKTENNRSYAIAQQRALEARKQRRMKRLGISPAELEAPQQKKLKLVPAKASDLPAHWFKKENS